MKTDFQMNKIRAVILYIAMAFKDGIDYIKLFKIMYFAQKDYIVRYGQPLFPESFRAFKHGPVPSFSYSAFKTVENGDSGVFGDFLSGIRVEGKKVFADASPDMDYLPVAGVACLDKMIRKYHDMDSYKMSGMSHDQAWKNARERMLDDPQKNFMSIIDIAKAGKASSEMIDYIREKQMVIAELS